MSMVCDTTGICYNCACAHIGPHVEGFYIWCDARKMQVFDVWECIEFIPRKRRRNHEQWARY